MRGLPSWPPLRLSQGHPANKHWAKYLSNPLRSGGGGCRCLGCRCLGCRCLGCRCLGCQCLGDQCLGGGGPVSGGPVSGVPVSGGPVSGEARCLGASVWGGGRCLGGGQCLGGWCGEVVSTTMTTRNQGLPTLKSYNHYQYLQSIPKSCSMILNT